METRQVTTEEEPSRQQLMDEAADWLARLDSGAADLADFEAWRNADPRRASAFVQVANAAQALDRAKPVLRRYPASSKLSRRLFLFAGLAIGTGVAAAGLCALTFGAGRASASTVIGERRNVILPNGATLELNTDSRAEWQTKSGRTQVWLKRGELALTVHTPGQICELRSGDTVADVNVGRVNARLRGEMLDLTVLAGKCAVRKLSQSSDRDTTATPVVLLVNQAVLTGRDHQVVRTLATPDVQFLSAWPTGELALEGQTLETAVGEYNRYLSHKIIIADPSLASVRLGGRFSSADPALFLDALGSSFGVKVSIDNSGTTVLTK